MNLSRSLIIAVALLLPECGLRAQPSLSSTNAAPQRLAVVDFSIEPAAVNARDWSAGLEDYFEMALEKQNVAVLERRNIRLVLGERGLQSHGLLSAESLSQAKLPSVDYFLSGTLASPTLNEFVLTIAVVRADKAEVVSALTRRGTYPTDWLPAIDSLAREVGERLQVAKPGSAQRSEFEMMTWLPEAALPFFKGLDFFGRGDYAAAIPWFRHSYEKEKHFELARRWEARAYRKLGLDALARVASGVTNVEVSATTRQRPVVAIVASAKVSAAGRAAFVQALAKDGRFELFEPAAIGATAREIDLQLTGQMATPLNDRSVWLVVDDVIHLDAPEPQTLAARQQSLLSGEILRQAKAQPVDSDEAGCAALAKAFLEKSPESSLQNSGPEGTGQLDLSEPTGQESPEVRFARILRLAAANPQSGRLWLGLADLYADETRRYLLERAIGIIATNREAPDAAFWLASALWREREMTRRIFYVPTPTLLAPNPITNDFARLLQWFPQSYEAQNLTEVTNHGSGSFVLVQIKDHRYLDSVFDYGRQRAPSPVATGEPPPKQPNQPPHVVTDEERLAMLNQYLRETNNARAWLVASGICDATPGGQDASVRQQAEAVKKNLFAIAAQEAQTYKAFLAACAQADMPKARELGERLLNCTFRRLRMEVIVKLGQIIKETQGFQPYFTFILTQMENIKADFEFDPVTLKPAEQDFDYYFYFQPADWPHLDPPMNDHDLHYAAVMGELAQQTEALSRPALSEKVFRAIWQNEALPLRNRLTAECDLANAEHLQGRDFEALEKVKEVLKQSEGTGLPVARLSYWTNGRVEDLAFDLLRKVRIYADAGGEICDCCGKVPEAPPQKPANYDEMNRKLGQLWKQQIGEAGTTNPPIEQQLLADKESLFPVILYKLRTGEEVSHLLIFCADLGTNALPALPLIVQFIHRGEPFQDYNNALLALGGLGHAAGCAKPLLLLARENAENSNFVNALKRIGPAPRRVMPLLAQLLNHKDPEVCKLAAKAIVETANPGPQFQNLSEEQQVAQIRKWWEETGSSTKWAQ